MSHRHGSKMERSARIDRILRARIADGTWPPGHVFTWPQIIEEFSLHFWDVSYVLSPVLRKMRIDGLIESRPYVGVRVVIEGETWSPPAAYAEMPHDEYIEIVLRERLRDGLKGEGIYRPGEQFSPLVDLAEEFGVSPATVRKATTPLKRQKILVLVGTNRTYVASDLAKFSTDELLKPSVRRRPGRMKLEAFGESLTLAEWARHPRCQVDRTVLHTRYVSGWGLENALTTPKSFSRPHPPKPWASEEPATQDAYTIARKTILSRISDETYPLGTVVSSADVAISLEISEESVLDALRDLHGIKIVDHRAGVGYFTAISPETLRATDASRST
jgi:DNA-binding GntR family transcriptional regulator